MGTAVSTWRRPTQSERLVAAPCLQLACETVDEDLDMADAENLTFALSGRVCSRGGEHDGTPDGGTGGDDNGAAGAQRGRGRGRGR